MGSSDPIRSKSQNYRLWQSGAFGNKLRSWRSLEEWQKSGFCGLVALRALLAGGGPCLYDLEAAKAVESYWDWIDRGIPPEAIMINEAAPARAVILQGEYRNGVYVKEDGSFAVGYFCHSRLRHQMRDALRKGSAVLEGLLADLVIRSAMTPAAHDDWQDLKDRYPDHVLEVSIYDRNLGDCPGRNALVWEVRLY